MNTSITHHKEIIKEPILQAKRTNSVALALLALPLLFMVGIILKHEIHAEVPWITGFAEWLVNIDPNSSGSFVSSNISQFLLGLPLVAIILVLFSILKSAKINENKALELSFKINVWGGVIFILSLLIFLAYMIFLFSR
ncbi:MAG: hypothetical protein AAF388_00270 [Bacteroidota bacterium]